MGLIRTPEDRFDDLPGYPYDPSYVEAGEARMAYVDEAGGGEETFLCLHGEPTWGYLYRKMLPTLADEGRVVVPDFVGFGRSDKYDTREAYTFEMHYDSLVAFVEALDLRNVTLVCQDWGSILGLPLAASEFPERVSRIVAMNAILADGTVEMPEVWHRFREMVETSDDLQVSRVIQNGCETPLSSGVQAAYDAPFPDEASKAGAYAWPPMVPRDPDAPGADRLARAREDLAEWEKPFFSLFGDSDAITREFRDLLRDLVPTASDQPDVWVEGASHFIQEDAGGRAAEHVVEFVRRTR